MMNHHVIRTMTRIPNVTVEDDFDFVRQGFCKNARRFWIHALDMQSQNVNATVEALSSCHGSFHFVSRVGQVDCQVD